MGTTIAECLLISNIEIKFKISVPSKNISYKSTKCPNTCFYFQLTITRELEENR